MKRYIVLSMVAALALSACVSDTGGLPIKFNVQSDGELALWSDLGNTVISAGGAGSASVLTLEGLPVYAPVSWDEAGTILHVRELDLFETYAAGEPLPAKAWPFIAPLFAPLTPEAYGFEADGPPKGDPPGGGGTPGSGGGGGDKPGGMGGAHP